MPKTDLIVREADKSRWDDLASHAAGAFDEPTFADLACCLQRPCDPFPEGSGFREAAVG
jgi:hypothetical protein